MREPFIFLSSEVSRQNAATLIRWLKDHEVSKYLSDSNHVAQDIERTVNRVALPILTHLFNQNGRFYIAYNKQGEAVGFVRLIKKSDDYEIVVVIGDRENWNKKLGTSLILESIRIAFIELRAKKVIAKIYPENKRSLRAFQNAGFELESKTAKLITYSLTIKQYVKFLKGATAMSTDIYVTSLDRERIKKILVKLSGSSQLDDKTAKKLQEELCRAIIVDPKQVSRDVITMNSKVVLKIDGEEMEVSLVYPEEADLSERKLSIFSPIGTAILGYKEGSAVEWEVPSGTSKIHIKKVLYQPEAAGEFEL